MDTKLTLKLDQTIINKAKHYAKLHDISLSILIETYLRQLMLPYKKLVITPLVKSLSGVVELPEKFDEKKIYKKHLLQKYGR